MKAMLVIADAVEGAHLIDLSSTTTDEQTQRIHTAVVRLLDANVDGTSWVCIHSDIRAELLPRQVRVWPTLNGFFAQFGVTLSDDDD